MSSSFNGLIQPSNIESVIVVLYIIKVTVPVTRVKIYVKLQMYFFSLDPVNEALCKKQPELVSLKKVTDYISVRWTCILRNIINYCRKGVHESRAALLAHS